MISWKCFVWSPPPPTTSPPKKGGGEGGYHHHHVESKSQRKVSLAAENSGNELPLVKKTLPRPLLLVEKGFCFFLFSRGELQGEEEEAVGGTGYRGCGEVGEAE